MKIKLPSGTTGFYNERNQWQCTGAAMGRRSTLPADLPAGDWQAGSKLHLVRLPLIDGGCYDSGGAYWGHGPQLWLATESLPSPSGVTLWLRASTRKEARAKALKLGQTRNSTANQNEHP